jgi:hypothetical protein
MMEPNQSELPPFICLESGNSEKQAGNMQKSAGMGFEPHRR